MRILLWHGYLLGGTGSNVYTRMLAREWSRAGHDVDGALPGARSGRATTSAARLSLRPDVGGLLPVFVLDRYEGYDVRRVQDCTPRRARPLGRGERLGAPRPAARRRRLHEPRPARRPGRRRRRARRSPSRRTAPSSSTRCAATPGSRPGARRRSRRPARRSSAPRTSAPSSRRCAATRTDVIEVPPGVDVDEWVPEPRDARPRGAARGGAPRPAEPRQRRGAPARRGQRRPARRASSPPSSRSSSTSAS